MSAAQNKGAAVVSLEHIVQEYPRPEGGVNRVVDDLTLRFEG
jgi:hypothetical protein